MLLLLSLAQAATCDATSQDLSETIGLAEKAFEAQDGAALLKRRDQLLSQLNCIKEPLGRPQIGEIHWIQTVSAFVEARPDDLTGAPDDSRTMAALSGVFDAVPTFQLPLSLPPDHTLRGLIGNANYRLDEPSIVPLPSPGRGRIEVNGKSATKIREQVAAVIQQFDGDNQLLSTCYWWPGQSLANCAQDLGPVPGATSSKSGGNGSKSKGVAPWIVGGASLALLGSGVGVEAYNGHYWEENFADCMGKLPLFPGAYTGGQCGFATEDDPELSYERWKTSWLGGLGLIAAGTLGLAGSGVMILTDGHQVVISGRF